MLIQPGQTLQYEQVKYQSTNANKVMWVQTNKDPPASSNNMLSLHILRRDHHCYQLYNELMRLCPSLLLDFTLGLQKNILN